MSLPEPAAQKPASSAREFFRFLRSEIKNLWLAFWKPFWKVTVVTAVLFFLFLAVLAFNFEPPAPVGGQVPEKPPIVLLLLFIAGYSLFYAFWIGLVVGGFRVFWHLVGGWIIVPMIVIPSAITLSLWLCSSWIIDEGSEAVQALVDSAKVKGFPATGAAAGTFLKALHGGGLPAAVLLCKLLVPFIVFDGFWIAVDPHCLLQFLQFALCFVAAVLLGLVPSGLLSIVLVSFSFVKRLKVRYRQLVAESGLC